MTTQTSESKSNGKSKPRGRIDREQQEAVTKLEPVKDSVGELEELYRASVTASEEFNDGVKAVAEESGLLAAVVRKFVKARCSDKFSEKKREIDQLVFVFDGVGEGN